MTVLIVLIDLTLASRQVTFRDTNDAAGEFGSLYHPRQPHLDMPFPNEIDSHLSATAFGPRHAYSIGRQPQGPQFRFLCQPAA